MRRTVAAAAGREESARASRTDAAGRTARPVTAASNERRAGIAASRTADTRGGTSGREATAGRARRPRRSDQRLVSVAFANATFDAKYSSVTPAVRKRFIRYFYRKEVKRALSAKELHLKVETPSFLEP